LSRIASGTPILPNVVEQRPVRVGEVFYRLLGGAALSAFGVVQVADVRRVPERLRDNEFGVHSRYRARGCAPACLMSAGSAIA
jgi:hypothetical protein